MIVPTAALLFLLLQTNKGAIEGAVINSVTDKPIAGAQVQATRISGPTAGVTGFVVGTVQVPAGIVGAVGVGTPSGMVVREGGAPVQFPPATTDTNGHFAFVDLEPGTYLLRAFADGYARQEFNTRTGKLPGMTAEVTVAAASASKDTVFRLIPGGTVSGQVTGFSGEPLVNLEVTLLRSTYDPDGRKTFQQAGLAQTNDRGEYRLFWVTPGRYYLSVAPSARPLPGVPFVPGLNANKYPRTFYPDTTDASSALLIEIQPAKELGGMDFRLADQPTYRVRGRVIDPSSGQAPQRGLSISIVPREPIVNTGIFGSGAPYNPADGTFELRDIPSGQYVIRAQLPFNGRFDPGQPPPVPATASSFVDVRGGDVDGVVLTFEPPVSISGRAIIDGRPANARANIFFRPAVLGPAAGPPPRPPQWNPDGTFRIDGILPGEYRVDACCIGGPQANTYVKEVRLGSLDLLGHPLVVSGPVSESLEVVFGEGASEITGTVQSESQNVPANVSVVLVPDRRERHDLYKIVVTDAAGHFTFRTVPPGSYKLFAWDDIERNSWFDADVLRNYETYGMPANVSESGTVTLNLKLIK